jgi:hypothetical protein
VYCGKIGPLTMDHIPPKCLFPKNQRNNLVKIPSCNECHGQNPQVSQDDEYFRLALALRKTEAEVEGTAEVRNTALRSLAKPNKVGFRKAFLKTTKPTEFFSRAGIYLGKGRSYRPDLDRLNSVAMRIIRGLFYHHQSYRIPDGWDIHAFETSGFHISSKEEMETTFGPAIRLLSQVPLSVIHGDIFSYRCVFADDVPYNSWWALIFFKRSLFFGFTSPAGTFPPIRVQKNELLTT